MATNADVARAAGVSGATVSYVLNDTPGQSISASTREAVLRAAEELGYRPNVLARSLRKGRGNGVLCPLPGLQLTHPLSLLLDACTAALEPLGLTVIPDFASYDDPALQLQAWTRLAPAAVIDVLLRHDDPVLPLLRSSGIPVLSAALPSEAPWESSGDVFAREQRLTQVTYLASKGHRTLALVWPPSIPLDPRSEKRARTALRRTATQAGVTLSEHAVELNQESLRSLVAGWLRDGVPNAVAAHNDDYAIALVTALVAAGIRVPEDVAVMGVDDLPLGRVVTPAITTLRADFTLFAGIVAETVDGILSGRRTTTALPVPSHQLVVRESA
ncbi:MAG: putative LacI family transcriptional regulator [Frankiales bacterium]|nr:putative LacI family transcriptional regulator [Frankiales bacterium]